MTEVTVISVPAQGPRGPQGLSGPQGTQGGQGIQGAAGPMGMIGPGYATTSLISRTITNTDPVIFSVVSDLGYAIGTRLRASVASDSTIWMEGLVTDYTGANLTIQMDKSNGAGGFSSWNINLIGEPGEPGGTPTNRTITTAGLATGGGDLTANRTITVLKASSSDCIAGTADDKVVTPLGLAATLTANAMPVGTVVFTIQTSAPAGWLMMNDYTLGDVTSGSQYASAAYQALFVLFYNNFIDTWAPVWNSAGTLTTRASQGTATTAWGNHCRILMSRVLGRVLGAAGSGYLLTPRAMGEELGEELHTLSVNELAKHSHGIRFQPAGAGGSGAAVLSGGYAPVQGLIEEIGGDAPHNIMQPTSFLKVMIKY